VRTLASALRDVGSSWRALAETDLLYKAIAFVTLTPLIGLLFRFLIARSGNAAVADVDIALFFFTTRPGVVALIFVSALVIAVIALEQACLMAIGIGRLRGEDLRVRDAFAHGAARSFSILRLTAILVVRVLALVAPFAVAAGAAYWLFLRQHDINFYLKDKPPAFWGAAAIVGAIGIALAFVVGKRLASWALVLPIVVFEGKLPILAFGESARRMEGRRAGAALALGAWAAAAIVLPLLATQALDVLGRALAPVFGGTLAGMLAFIGVAVVTWLAATVAIGILTNALFSTIVVRLYTEDGIPEKAGPLRYFGAGPEIEGQRFHITWKALLGGLLAAMLITGGAGFFLMKTTWTDRTVLVIAHRGASDTAPENTLAAFKLAGEQHTDYVELDVQESADGVVLVAHDVDLMRVAHSPLKIWDTEAAELRKVDIGSYRAPEYADQRVPTLAEALAICKGVSRMDIELKQYGHDQRLEERVVELVEAAGMQDQIVTMSLDGGMVAKMKELRPAWTSGLLIAKALGETSHLKADFLAVESHMATRRFVRSAHAAGKPVYVWTVDDANRMIRMIGLGVDGLITNQPGLAKQVIATYNAMPPPQRLLVFVMTTLGAKGEVSEPADDLRP
jgi:glycerophosphoryl diester phosphodiesterase